MSKEGDHFHITSHNQAGGITAGQVFIGGGQRTLLEGDAALLLNTLPKAIPVEVTAALGDGEAFTYAQQMKDFLEANGYKVNGVNQAVWSRPVTGVNVITGETPRKIQVGSKPR